MNHFYKIIFLVQFIFLTRANLSFSQETSESLKKLVKFRIEVGPEFIWPSSYYQSIHTTSINSIFWIRYFKKAQLNMSFGTTTTYAWVTSLDFYHIRPKLVYYKTSAFGTGPIIQLNQSIFEMGRFSFEGTAVGGLIIYNKKFPYGGDIYNFMLRAGTDFGYKMNENIKLKLCCRWLHVSNGKGPGPNNPYYEGYGLGVSITKYFY